jgi:hypothetical protein
MEEISDLTKQQESIRGVIFPVYILQDREVKGCDVNLCKKIRVVAASFSEGSWLPLKRNE